MQRSTFKAPRGRLVALAVGAGVLSSLAAAPGALAAGQGPKPPTYGTACQTDGKVMGEGSTFQNNEVSKALATGYQKDVCGPVGSASNLQTGFTSDPAGSTMIGYNFPGANSGSGGGLSDIGCRRDPFVGTDLPYSDSQLATINGPASGNTGCATAATPYPPNSVTWPVTGDATAKAMSFPIGGGAVAFGINMAGKCTTPLPSTTTLYLTANELDEIWQGTLNQFNDSRLVATNPILSTDGCSGTIQRVVRFDNSGTTSITMNTLNGIDSGTLCDKTSTWASLYANSPNTTWPQGCSDPNSNVAPNTTTSGSKGSGSLITTVFNNGGDIGYAELGLWTGAPATANMFYPAIESASGVAADGADADPVAHPSDFVAAGSPGKSSNCNIGVAGLPGAGGPNDAVGLSTSNWSNSATGTANKVNITFQGAGYPACGLTWDMMYTGMDNQSGEAAPITGASTTVAGPFQGQTNDQVRTLYSYFTYVFSPLGQSQIDAQTYDELPAAWLTSLRQGFQFNF